MNQRKLDYIKRKIRKSYEKYLGGDKTALLDIARDYNIPTDENRIEDYHISKIYESIPGIEIIDFKTNTSYMAYLVGEIEPLNMTGDFIRVISANDLRKEEAFYALGSSLPLLSSISFGDGDLELSVEKDCSLENPKTFVSFRQNINHDGQKGYEQLLTKISYDGKEDEKIDILFTGPYIYNVYDGSQSTYTLNKDDNVIHIINELRQKGYCHNMRGICLERTSDFADNDAFVMSNSLIELNENDSNSLMLFSLFTEDSIECVVQIYKTSSDTKIIHQARKNYYGKVFRTDILDTKEYSIPNIFAGSITSMEIRNIISFMQNKLDATILAPIASSLTAFAHKIDVRKGLCEEADPLSPRIFANLSFEEICALINAHKKDYFSLVEEQFQSIANVSRKSDDAKRALKSED